MYWEDAANVAAPRAGAPACESLRGGRVHQMSVPNVDRRVVNPWFWMYTLW